MLYRDLAPISEKAWEEIDETASEVLKSYLTGRKVVKVNGPKGLDHNVITEGRLGNVEEKGEIYYGNYEVLPLTEVRREFEMKRWELDNISRGAKDVDYDALEEAVKEVALFEDNAIYNGLEDAMIKGIEGSREGETIDLGKDSKEIMEAVTEGVIRLQEAYAEGPYTLVVNEEAYKRILSVDTGYPFEQKIEKLIEGKVILSHVVDGAYLLPYDHDDLELTIGRDYSIGYQAHDIKRVRFFIAESFTFRVLDPGIIVKFEV